MQRGIWTLAISGMMAFYQGAYAADPAPDEPSGRASVGTARVGTNSTSKPAKKSKTTDSSTPKNYYKDLFGDDAPTPSAVTKRNIAISAPTQTQSADWEDDLPEEPAGSSSKSVPKKNNPKLDESDPFDLPSQAESSPPPAANKAKAAAKVTHATYDKGAGRKAPVQQTRSDGRPRSAPPVVGSDDTVEKSPRVSVGVRSNARASMEQTTESESDSADAEAVHSGPQTPQVTVEWVKRGEFNVGRECLVDLIVKNNGEAAVSQVVIDAIFPTTVRLTSAEPRPAAATDHLTWTFDQLDPASEKRITVKLVPSRRGEVGATAQVRFTGVSSTAFSVCEPLLKVSVKSPTKEIMIGDPVSQMITVTNPGTGTAQDVKIEAKLSDGLEHPTHEDRLVIDVGPIGPGETRTYRLPLTAAKGGHQTVNLVATSSSDASSTDSAEFDIVAPSLKIAVEGPSLRYKGRNAKYVLTVTNDGSIVNNNIHISQVVADGFKFMSADHHGKFDPSIRSIHWFVERLEPGESTQVSCDLQSLHLGEFAHTVQVVSDTGVQADARIETRVDGIASLTMELSDLDDPIETGSETAYEIKVRNDGSKAATGVTLSCELPTGMEMLSCKAPVGQAVEGRQLTFQPIEQIAPGGHVSIRIHMKVVRDGSHRMRVRLAGGGLQETMVLEEVTRAYSDNSN